MESNVVRYIGHGAFFVDGGESVEPTLERIEITQKYYISKFQSKPEADAIPTETIYDEIADDVVARALHIEEFLAVADPPRSAHIRQVNRALRFHYLTQIRGLERSERHAEFWRHGLSAEELENLKDVGLHLSQTSNPTSSRSRTASQPLGITSSGAAYVEDCRHRDVPVPETVLCYNEDGTPCEDDAENVWRRVGEIGVGAEDHHRAFIRDDLENELWYFESDDDKKPYGYGTCMALPRWDGNSAKQFQIICLGQESSKACFFDMPAGENYPKGEQRDIGDFLGGADLVNNPNGVGVCSDCHAGENPMVVHPDDPDAFRDEFGNVGGNSEITPEQWYDPLVVPDWPQNPGPLQDLPDPEDTNTNELSCTACHDSYRAMRFPNPSTELDGWCDTVFGEAAPDPDPAVEDETMPDNNRSRGNYDKYKTHVDFLEDQCNKSPAGTVEQMQPPSIPQTLSPPDVVEPIYQCANTLAVRGVRRGATIRFRVDGQEVGTREASDPRLVEFDLSSPLETGHIGVKIEARQEFDGMVSDWDDATVSDFGDDYEKIPRPKIRPYDTHECASKVGVVHPTNAKWVEVRRNADNNKTHKTWAGATRRTHARADGSFSMYQPIEARIEICGEWSEWSDPLYPGEEPTEDWKYEVETEENYAGQELIDFHSIVRGASLDISVKNEDPTGTTGSWPYSSLINHRIHYWLERPLQKDDEIVTEASLCKDRPPTTSPPVRPCSELPAPKIAEPQEGDDFVTMVESVPGAIIVVWGGNDNAIGFGGGDVIKLTRELNSGEQMKVMQLAGECESSYGFVVDVQAAPPEE